MLRNVTSFGSAVDDLQRQMAMSDVVNVVGLNSTGASTVGDEGSVLKAPSGILSYEPDELMISVFAGSSISDINDELQRAKQRIPIPEWGTIGGAVATRRNGLRDSHHQTLPNNVLRCSVIAANGSLYQSGGQVVKNVSGFDLIKLLVGSWGLLGLIVEVTMRTEPIPQVSQWMQSAGPTAIAQVKDLYRPSVVTCIEGITYVLLEGHAKDVQQQILQLDGFSLSEMPLSSNSPQLTNVNRSSQGVPHSIEREIRKQFDPSNKLNRHIASQRDLLT